MIDSGSQNEQGGAASPKLVWQYPTAEIHPKKNKNDSAVILNHYCPWLLQKQKDNAAFVTAGSLPFCQAAKGLSVTPFSEPGHSNGYTFATITWKKRLSFSG